MKKNVINEELAHKAMQEIAELERASGLKVRSGVRSGATEGATATTPRCKPWLCPQPLYGVVLIDDLF